MQYKVKQAIKLQEVKLDVSYLLVVKNMIHNHIQHPVISCASTRNIKAL